ncbi:MAG: alpha/beta hydrolase [Alphaproteobacteria bacterium]|nr:alpha/beta hydrolase [Alphaproteobacteria bacterium]MBU1550281.1 alpha/beta hydrolase [Alphaproteobacteria bacterium]MBU2337798.1 alpha/beta hydrolase [Alphaproteobacteria bacterium]MBU2387778.1 alpha/beta hydrolase [Alphaproteobacteria bacterium]
MITGAAHHPRRLLAALVPLLLAATLSGCAGRPEGVLVPTASAAAPGEQVDILVATTRQPSKDPGILFSGERGRGLEATDIAVSIPPAASREVGEVQWPKRLPADPAKEFATVRVAPVNGEAEAGRWLSQHLPPSKRVFVFVHGFNNRYEEAVYRFAQIVHDSGTEAAPVLFTWPSRASIFDYNYDKESANYSRDGLEDVLDQIADNPQVEDIVIMAHSMGSWLTVEALRQMAIRDGRVAPKIRNVILASPDLDVDVFSQQLDTIGKPGPNFTLFVSRDDRALQLSRRISGSIDRLGQVDPTVEPYRTEFEKAGITVLDLTALKSGDPLNHGKFAQSPQVVQLIGSRLLAGQEITTSDVALGDRLGAIALGTAQTVGGVASATVSAPIAVFDPNTRRTYGEQLNRVGRSLENTIVSTVAN